MRLNWEYCLLCSVMTRSFNTTGPCRPDIHYMLSSTARLPNLERLIEQQNYFVIHAPRQTGKSRIGLCLWHAVPGTPRRREQYEALLMDVNKGLIPAA